MKVERLLQDSMLAAAEEAPSKEAVVTGRERASYGDLLDQSLRIARVLQDHGLEHGDRVALLMDNSVACAASIFGALLAGGVFVVVNPQTKRDKLEYILNDCEATVLVTEGPLARVAASAVERVPSIRATLCSNLPEGFDPIVELEQATAAAEPVPDQPGTIPLDLAALIYTSGSTGHPKGVMMTHQSMVFAAGSISEYLRLASEHRILNVLPLAFDYGLYQLLMSIHVGGTLVLETSFAYPARTLKLIEDESVTVFPGVPTVFATLVSMHERDPLSFPGVQRITNTAADLPAAFHEPLHEIFPSALVFRMYGLTECKRVSYLEPELLESKPSSVGKAIPGTQVVVLDAAGRPAAPGKVGTLHVRGPHVMAGYWRQPELSAEMLRPGPLPGEQMLCTHDFFTTDDEGFLYFVGRSDDIIKTRGEKVSPVEVENALYAIKGVREAAVIGVHDDLLGEAIRAYVVLEPDSELTEQAIIHACRERLENFMVPSQVAFRDTLPKTESGKIRRRDLIEAEPGS